MLALWLYATSEGVGSASELDRLWVGHDAYRWLCGGVSMTITRWPISAPGQQGHQNQRTTAKPHTL